jgi:hypothetical protein
MNIAGFCHRLAIDGDEALRKRPPQNQGSGTAAILRA